MSKVKLQLAAIQLVSSPDIAENLLVVEQQLAQLRVHNSDGAMLVVLPECCLIFAKNDEEVRQFSEQKNQGIMQQALSELCIKFNLYMVAGTIPIQADDGRHYAASLLLDPQGVVLAQYNKIHLFDVQVSDGVGSYRESDNTHPGQDICVVDTPIGKIGLAVCYDLRFSALFRAMSERGADIMVLPSAFTEKTGKAHWELLIRARAIENQCYMIAANQGGDHVNGRQTWGQTMIVNAWGDIEAQIAKGVGHISCSYQAADIDKMRQQMPMASQQCFAPSHLK
ncbi:MAG: carbon-nitrogen hydrolase family protein [Psychrobium sp.]|nr:carbon-nitrogen hydrolase family protein [Psychrobium sp.]